MRVAKTGLLAAALVVGFGAAASAQSVEIRTRTSTPGYQMQDDDADVSTTRVVRRSVERRVVREPSATATVTTTRRGASYYAPGQVKKRVHVQSAREYAPGHLDDDDTTTIVRRRVRTID